MGDVAQAARAAPVLTHQAARRDGARVVDCY
jgi:hypothetical protein